MVEEIDHNSNTSATQQLRYNSIGLIKYSQNQWKFNFLCIVYTCISMIYANRSC